MDRRRVLADDAGVFYFVATLRNGAGVSTGQGFFSIALESSVSGPTVDVDGDGQVEALTDALLILRYAFGFRGAVLITGVVDLANCTRCDAVSIEAFLAGLSL